MKRIGRTPDIREMLLSGSVFLIPFLSWGKVPWLTGVFSLVVALVMLLRIRDDQGRGPISVPVTALWIPFAVIFCLSAAHIFRSPVPYSSLLFTVHLTLAGVFYILLLDSRLPDPGDAVLFWTFSLVAWTVVQVLATDLPVPSGPFLNPNYLATVLLTCLAWTLGSLFPADLSRRRTTVLFVAALAATAGLAVIGSRSAGLAILALWGLYMVKGKGRLRAVAAIVIVLVFLLPTTLKHRVTEEHRQDPHAFSRLLIWKASLQMGLDHPIMGVGPNLYYEYSPPYAFPTDELPVRYGRIARKPHNEYLRSWAEGGMLGVSGVLLFLLLTSRLLLDSWRRKRAGPVLAVGVILFQALFHDLTEVFALIALGVWWLARVSTDDANRFEMPGRSGKVILTGVGAVVLLFSLWLNLDVSSRVLWMKGQRIMVTDTREAVKVLARAHGLNPLLPGLGRDLAWAHLSGYRNTGTPEDLDRTGAGIRKARELNRLDTVPMRLEAALHVEQANKGPKSKARDHLFAASGILMEALKLEPYNALIMISLAGVYRDLGDHARALAMVERALETEPNYLEAHRTKIFYLSGMNPDEVNEAEKELEKAEERAAGYRPHSTYEEIILR